MVWVATTAIRSLMPSRNARRRALREAWTSLRLTFWSWWSWLMALQTNSSWSNTRIFGTVNTELLAGLPGYIAEGHPWPTPKLSLAELDAALEEFVITYNDRTHSELGTSPRAAWIADGWLPRMPESLEDLDGLLLTVAQTRVVRRDGIHFQGLRYISPTLAGYVGRAVVIRYDPRDITEILSTLPRP